jgi:hypothetical protein
MGKGKRKKAHQTEEWVTKLVADIAKQSTQEKRREVLDGYFKSWKPKNPQVQWDQEKDQWTWHGYTPDMKDLYKQIDALPAAAGSLEASLPFGQYRGSGLVKRAVARIEKGKKSEESPRKTQRTSNNGAAAKAATGPKDSMDLDKLPEVDRLSMVDLFSKDDQAEKEHKAAVTLQTWARSKAAEAKAAADAKAAAENKTAKAKAAADAKAAAENKAVAEAKVAEDKAAAEDKADKAEGKAPAEDEADKAKGKAPAEDKAAEDEADKAKGKAPAEDKAAEDEADKAKGKAPAEDEADKAKGKAPAEDKAAEDEADKAKGKAPTEDKAAEADKIKADEGKKAATGAAASRLGKRKKTCVQRHMEGVPGLVNHGAFSKLSKTWGKSKVFTQGPSSAAKKKAGLDTVHTSMGVWTCQMVQNDIDLEWYTQRQMDNAIATGKYKRTNFFEKSQPITTVVRNDGTTHSEVKVRIYKRLQQVVQCVSGCTCRGDPFANIASWTDTRYELATHSDGCPWKDKNIPDGELPLSTFKGLQKDKHLYEVVTVHDDALPAAAGGADRFALGF